MHSRQPTHSSVHPLEGDRGADIARELQGVPQPSKHTDSMSSLSLCEEKHLEQHYLFFEAWLHCNKKINKIKTSLYY